MNTTITVDRSGRVVLPKPVRDELQLAAGDSLELAFTENEIVLRPVRRGVGLRKKQGVWVLDVDAPISLETVNRTVRDIRQERERSWLGNVSEPQRTRARGKRSQKK